MAKDEELILIDTDVLIHLNKAEKMSLLRDLFPGRVYMLDFIIEELRSMSGSQIDMMLKLEIVKEMPFPTRDMQIFNEYNNLKKTKGKGESACMAICRYQKNILASSNLKDIRPYCATHSIKFLTTMDILCIALLKGFITLAESDECVNTIQSKGSKLPYATLQEYLNKDFDSDKLNY
jgi:predicted nucleic acid-binding protein